MCSIEEQMLNSLYFSCLRASWKVLQSNVKRFSADVSMSNNTTVPLAVQTTVVNDIKQCQGYGPPLYQ